MKTSCGRTYKGLGGNGVGIGNGRGPPLHSGRGLGGRSSVGGLGAQGTSSVGAGGGGTGAGLPAGGDGGYNVGGGMWLGGNTQAVPICVEPGGGLKARI